MEDFPPVVDAPGPMGGGRFRPYVKAIIEAERAPIKLIEGRKSKENDKLKLLQEFTGRVRKMSDAMRELDGYRKFRTLKADMGDEKGIVELEVDSSVAEAGEYQLEVVQLAGRHSMISDGFENPDDEVGVGYFWYTTPDGDSKSVYFDEGSTTLKDLVTAINREPELGLQANLVNDGTGGDYPWRIIVAAKKTGMDEDIVWPDFYFVDGDVRFTIDQERAAQSAIVKLNGFEILTPENKIADLIPGVSMKLLQAKEGHEFTVNISEDTEKISGKVKGMVDQMNAVLDFINKQNQLDEKTDTSRTLGGDGMLRTIEGQLRNLVLSPFYVGGDEDHPVAMRASDIGIRFQRSGQLELNQDLFKKKLTEDFDHVAEFFSGQRGFVPKLKVLVDNLTNIGNGLLVQREKNFRSRARAMDDQIAQKEQQIGRKEQALKNKFANLEATISNMQSQQSYLAQALGGGGGLSLG